jgi:hypothetical protein
MPTDTTDLADDRTNDHGSTTANLHGGGGSDCGFLFSTTGERPRSLSQTQVRRGKISSFLEEFDMDDEDQYVDIEEDVQNPPASSDVQHHSRTRGARDADCASSSSSDANHAKSSQNDETRRPTYEPRHHHSLINLNDVPTADNQERSLPRRISFECHASAIFEGMEAGGEFSDSSDSDSGSSCDDENANEDQRRQRRNNNARMPHHRPSSHRHRLRNSAAPAAANIRRAGSAISLRRSESLISLASISEEPDVREAPCFVSKVDRYIVNREIRLGSGIVRSRSEQALAKDPHRQGLDEQETTAT